MQVMHATAMPRAATTATPRTRVCPTCAPLVQPSQRMVVMRAREDGESNSRIQQQVTDRLQGLGDKLKDQVQQPQQQQGQSSSPTGQWQEPVVPGPSSAFTRQREVWVGRLAMIGVIAAGTSELLMPGHPNILVQVSSFLNTGLGLPIGPKLVFGGFLAIMGYSAITALNPASPTWSDANQRDVAKRNNGPTIEQGTSVNVSDPKSFFGISGWGFSKANELLHGRLAMLGFAGLLFNQVLLGGFYGPGPLAQLAAFLNVPASEAYYASVPVTFFTWAALATALGYLNDQRGEKEGDKDLY